MAAAVLAFAFLPVAYSRVAVTDVGALIGVALSLGLAVLAHQRGGWKWFGLAGAAAGLAVSFKYTAGLALLPVAIAALARLRSDGARALGGLALGCGLAAVVFVALNPYLFGSLDAWWSDLRDQADVARDQPKPGQESGGVSYYLDSLTWGLGWAAAFAALAGAVIELRRNLVRGLMLIAVPLALFVYLSAQSRYFGRWLLPAYPALAMLAAAAIGQAAELVAARTAALKGNRPGLGTHSGALSRTADRGRGGRRPHRCRSGPTARRRHPQRAGARPRRHAPAGARLARGALPARAAGVRRAGRAGALVPLEPRGRPAQLAEPLRAAGRLDGAGLVVRGGRRRARVRPVQARPRRAPGRRHSRVGSTTPCSAPA